MYNTKTLIVKESMHVKLNDKDLGYDTSKLIEKFINTQIMEKAKSQFSEDKTFSSIEEAFGRPVDVFFTAKVLLQNWMSQIQDKIFNIFQQ